MKINRETLKSLIIEVIEESNIISQISTVPFDQQRLKKVRAFMVEYYKDPWNTNLTAEKIVKGAETTLGPESVARIAQDHGIRPHLLDLAKDVIAEMETVEESCAKRLLEEDNKPIEESFIQESYSDPLIVVDVQKGHQDYISFDLDEFAEYINSYDGEIYYIFNGEELGYEGVDELKDWLSDIGIDEDIVYSMEYIEKSYGFIRDAMDRGVDEDEIVSILKYMDDNEVQSIEELIEDKGIDTVISDLKFSYDEQDYLEDVEEGSLPFYFPSVIDEIKALPDNGIIAGGGDQECLLEIELLLQALDKNYNRNNTFVY